MSLANLEQRFSASQQLWLPSSFCNAEKRDSEQIALDWATCLRLSSGAKVHDDQMTDKKKPRMGEKARALEEKELLAKWIGTARWTYNECLRAIKEEGVPKFKKALRARAINKEAAEMLNKPWLEETPYDIRDAPTDDLLKAFEGRSS
ncbi:hypothetical protein POJ06DRAFT_267085 [Lipomyces tetrasporus]|uniref:Transposase putative helix-turn-helix domain-containing protein n=1 Tax=Lipomyces tetrasporus TaxID=54092 RepID=A0AAD7QSW4_9ASCO|nr:uncharacterized protein POJ06DRAFT_267085 [Lipomyces tetrasporus]KAJ8100917.1 hypothetical protein POJ06DRAFT_267085 [Lipomyces tetrasporus]